MYNNCITAHACLSTEWNLESICGGDVEENATLRCDLGRQGSRTTHVVPAHFEMKEGEYELGRKGKCRIVI